MALTIDELQIEIRARAESASKSVDELTGSLQQLTSAVKKTAKLPEVPKQMDEMAKSAKKAGDAMKKSASGLNKFVSSLKRILMYRVVRSILSNIAQSAREGVRNLAQYSAALGGIDASHANATMSKLATTGLQLKNAFGAALMPVLNAVMPVIQKLADWFIIAANAVNQFFAALSGSKAFTKAKTYAADYAAGLDKASKSAKALKSHLLGFDELNVIQESGGIGGGGGAPELDPSKMFEEGEIDNKIAAFADKVKPLFDFIKDNIETIAVVLLGALLLPKLASVLQMLKSIAGVGLIGAGIAMLAWAIKDIQENGVNLKNTLIEIGGILAIGAGIAILAGSWIPLLVAAITSVVVALANAYGEGENLVAGFMLILGGLKDFIVGVFTGDMKLSLQGVGKVFDGLKGVIGAILNTIEKLFLSFFDWLDKKTHGRFTGIINWLKGFIVGAVSVIRDTVAGIIDSVKTVFEGLVRFIGGGFSADWDLAWDGIKDILKGAINLMISLVEGLVNTFVWAANSIIKALNTIKVDIPDWVPGFGGKTFGINIPLIPNLKIPRFAAGGFPVPGELFIANEAGPELVGTMGGRTAVANNDQIVQAVSEGVYEAVVAAMARADGGENASVNVYLDGKQINASVRKTQREKGAGILQSGVVFA